MTFHNLSSREGSGAGSCLGSGIGSGACSGSVGKINANTLPLIIDWLKKHDVPYDEIYTAKPWCGEHGFYIDDRAIRPEEFVRLSYFEICALIGIES